jgi:predicted RNA-binding Zn ribbon-like protein
VLELRERLRDALEAATHGETSDSAYARLDEIAADVPLRVRFGAATRLEPARRRAAPAIGPILATVFDALGDEALDRLKVCRNDACRWAFYDTSRNRSGVWCSMAICGNRQKGRVYRSRHAADR